MSIIAQDKTDLGFGTWVQTDTSISTYVKIVIPGGARP
jgi:hypothetical protein